MGWFKKNILLVVAIPAVTVFIFAYGLFAAASDNATFRLEDVYGDREALNGAVITGVLQDRYHNQHFEISNGKVRSSFRCYHDARDIIRSERWRAPGNGEHLGGDVYWYSYEYEISAGAKTEEVLKEREGETEDTNTYPGTRESVVYTDSIDVYAKIWITPDVSESPTGESQIRFNTGVKYVRGQKDIEFEKREYVIPENVYPDEKEEMLMPSYNIKRMGIPANPPKMAMAFIDGELYFTVTKTSGYSGNNGIFKAREFDNWWEVQAGQTGTVETVTRFSLDEADNEALGLEAVGDSLVLVMFANDVLTIKAFDTAGRLLDEMVVGDIKRPDGLFEYSGYVNDSTLNICLRQKHENQSHADTILSINFNKDGNGLSLGHKVDRLFLEDEAAYHFNIVSKDDRLYVVSFIRNLDETGSHPTNFHTPGELIIYVYRTLQGETALAYRGELVTDANEDFLRDENKYRAPLGYDYYDYRNFEMINVEQE